MAFALLRQCYVTGVKINVLGENASAGAGKNLIF